MTVEFLRIHEYYLTTTKTSGTKFSKPVEIFYTSCGKKMAQNFIDEVQKSRHWSFPLRATTQQTDGWKQALSEVENLILTIIPFALVRYEIGNRNYERDYPWIVRHVEQMSKSMQLPYCHGTFTDWSIFGIPFLWWKKGCSGPVTQWRQLVSCDWSWHNCVQGNSI